MPEYQELELAKAADVVVRELLKVKKGESMLITQDTEGEWLLYSTPWDEAMATNNNVLFLFLGA